MTGTDKVKNDKSDREWKRADGIIVKDEGANAIPNRFDGATRAAEHYKRHQVDYPQLTQQQYIDKAATLASSAAGNNILGFTTDNGSIVRYDKQDNDFAMAEPGPNGYIKTLFKPKNKIKYYHDQKKAFWKYRKGK